MMEGDYRALHEVWKKYGYPEDDDEEEWPTRSAWVKTIYQVRKAIDYSILQEGNCIFYAEVFNFKENVELLAGIMNLSA